MFDIHTQVLRQPQIHLTAEINITATLTLAQSFTALDVEMGAFRQPAHAHGDDNVVAFVSP